MAVLLFCYDTLGMCPKVETGHIGKSKLLQELPDHASTGPLTEHTADKKVAAWQSINSSILPSHWKYFRQP